MKIKIMCFTSILFIMCPVQASPLIDFHKPGSVANNFIELSLERSKYGYDSYTYIGKALILDPGAFKYTNNAISFSLGTRMKNNCGAQISYANTQNVNLYVADIHIKQHLSSFFIDGLYFLPIWRNMELKLLVGTGLYSIQYNTNSIEENHITTGGVRCGSGLQYNFNKYIASSIMYKYQAPSYDSAIKYISGISLGLVYNF